MVELTAKLLGTPQVLFEGREIVLPYKKADALLYFLILNRKALRSELTGLLWTDSDSTTALKNLRHAAYSIRKAIGYNLFAEGQRSVLELAPEIDIHCDVQQFEDGDILAYHGEFLEDFAIPHADVFEAWASDQRSHLRAQYLKQLFSTGKTAFAARDLTLAEHCCNAYLRSDPLEESVVAMLMQIYQLQKKYRHAIELYDELRQNLESEFGLPPLKETSQLYYKIVSEWNVSTDKETLHQMAQPLLGKEDALQKMHALCAEGWLEHGARCIFLQGGSGIGKSFLLEHFLENYDFSDRRICRASCYQTEMDISLAPWNTIMLALVSEFVSQHIIVPKSYLKSASKLFPCLAFNDGQGGEELEEGFSSPSNYYAARESALLVLTAVAKRIPLLLIFEDVHWMDTNSAEMLALFLRRLSTLNVCVICTGRDILPEHMQLFLDRGKKDKLIYHQSLRNLSLNETARLIECYLKEGVYPELVEQLYQGTGGNPLLLVQLLTSLDGSQDITKLLQDPYSIIARRLSSLSPEARQILDVISIFAGKVSFDILTSLLTKDALELIYLCEHLKQYGLLSESSDSGTLEYSFAHDQIKSIVISQQTEARRRILHLRVAQYLETQQQDTTLQSYETLIYHFSAGGNRFKAFKYRILSLNLYAELCYELLPTLEAGVDSEVPAEDNMLNFFDELEHDLTTFRSSAFESSQDLDKLEIVLLYAESRYCIHNGIYEKGCALLDRLLQRENALHDTAMLIKTHLQYIYYGVQIYRTDIIEQHLQLGMALLGDDVCAELAIYLRLSGLHKLMLGRYEEARETLFRSVRMFQVLDPGSGGKYAINIAGTYNYVAETYRLEGNFQQAFSYYDQAIAHNRSRNYYPGAAVFYTNYAVAAFQHGDKAVARQLFEYALTIYRTSHEYSELPIALSYLALYDTQDGDYALAADRISEALQLSARIGSPWWTGVTIYILWHIRLLLEATGDSAPSLEALWPADKAMHCNWGLSFLRKLEPRAEQIELESALATLEHGL